MGKTKIIRKPFVAGQFYPASFQDLKRQIETLVDQNVAKLDAIACMLPHAGYMYSGEVAGETVSRIIIKDRVILLGPNHTGSGEAFSVMTDGVWQTPMGAVQINSALAKQILNHSKYLKEDTIAHAHEHSLEVELPFLQYFKPNFEIVPVAILSDEIDILKEIGKGIAAAIKESNAESSTLIVASTDMTHYEPQAQAQKKDKEAISAILELNEDKLMDTIQKLNISMCGYAPVAVMLAASKSLGAKKAELIKYQTSGEASGDFSSVVGYAGIAIY